jgi:glycosyltransferase involved in cell wall biosynthesis
MPRISIVIPTYNRAADLRRALASVQRQTCTDWECLVVDNHSTDGTDEVVAGLADPRVRLLKVHNDGIIAVSRNVGLANAAGEYLAFLDSDDWWTPQKLAASLGYLERGAALVYHDLYLVTRAGQRVYWRRSRSRAVRSPAFDDLLVHGNALNTSSVVIRSELMRRIGGFCEDRTLVAAEDYDAWLQAAKASDALVRIPRTLGYYWVGSTNMTNPSRTLQLLDVLEQRYARDLQRLGADHSIYWLPYVRARMHYLMGSHELARRHLTALRWRRAPLPIHLKSLWMSLSIGLQRSAAHA